MLVVVGGGPAGLDGVEGCFLKSAEIATSLPTTNATTVAPGQPRLYDACSRVVAFARQRQEPAWKLD